MKKIVFVIGASMFFSYAFAQDSALIKSPKSKKISLNNRPGDHLLIQLSSDHLNGMTDSIRTHQKGLSHGFNIYFMLDKPFKASPNYSVAFGVGISTSNITFRRMNSGVNATLPQMPFTALDSTSHFKHYKLATSYAEIPVEIRYFSNPEDPNKSWKAALGARVGVLVNAHTKGKILVDKNGNTLNNFTEKEISRRFISSTRLMATARVGYGILSLFGAFQVNTLLKDGAGPAMNLYQIGLTVSGL